MLNSLEVVDQQGGDDAYMLVDNNDDVREKLAKVGVTSETIRQYGDDESFCVLALAFGEGYCDEYDNQNKRFVLWGPIDDDLRQRVIDGLGNASDAERLLRALEPDLFGEKAEFGTFAAHQPGYDKFKERGMLDDYVYQALVHMGNASEQWSWANTVLEHAPHVPNVLKECIRSVSSTLHPLAEELRVYSNAEARSDN
ncbi:hypothetical protein [Paenibacillus sp. VTT E-133291]|uniref:hypothetical protein n=1 Tax=Paenibacillus sp. VTT E-133291 TaxID=1986223 RepID=UPI0015C6549A|nr:hypothetical protein [Paenibacillus sp. VTT E-133291]